MNEAPDMVTITDDQYNYLVKVYENVLGWFHNADNKAQLILTLNGLIVSIFTGQVFLGDRVATESVRTSSVLTKLLLAGAATATAAGVLAAMLCLWSRLGESRIRHLLAQLDVDPNDPQTYQPAIAWWFGAIAQLRPKEFSSMIAASDTAFRRDALASQISILSRHVLRKYRWVNRAWALTGLSFVCMASAITTSVIGSR